MSDINDQPNPSHKPRVMATIGVVAVGLLMLIVGIVFSDAIKGGLDRLRGSDAGDGATREHESDPAPDLSLLLEVDRWARELGEALCSR